MSKNIKISLLILVILILIIFLALKVFKVQNRFLLTLFPKDYSEYVYKYAEEFNVDSIMIFAIIKAESNFNSSAVSKSEATGLMQLIDSTAKETAEKLGYEYHFMGSLYDPEINIMLGTKYYSDLLENYEGNELLALTAYNAGIGNVANWIELGIIKKDGSDIENIPFKETNKYVRKILRNYTIYQDLYGE